MKRFYKPEDLKKNDYAVIEWDDEDEMLSIVSLHKEKAMAEKRVKHLNTPKAWNNHFCYCIWKTSDERIKWDNEDEVFYLLRG